jgi:hypothetical protein
VELTKWKTNENNLNGMRMDKDTSDLAQRLCGLHSTRKELKLQIQAKWKGFFLTQAKWQLTGKQSTNGVHG